MKELAKLLKALAKIYGDLYAASSQGFREGYRERQLKQRKQFGQEQRRE